MEEAPRTKRKYTKKIKPADGAPGPPPEPKVLKKRGRKPKNFSELEYNKVKVTI